MRYSYEEVSKLFSYNPLTGEVTRKMTGHIIRGINHYGYIIANVCRKGYLAHKIAWTIFYGRPPKLEIDHINGDRSDNVIDNLREVTRRGNCQNMKKHREGKLLGAHLDKTNGRWYSSVILNKKKINLGHYGKPEEAHAAYIKFVGGIHAVS